MWCKTAKLTGEAVSADQRLHKIVQKCLLNVVQERNYAKEKASHVLGLGFKDIAKWTYSSPKSISVVERF